MLALNGGDALVDLERSGLAGLSSNSLVWLSWLLISEDWRALVMIPLEKDSTVYRAIWRPFLYTSTSREVSKRHARARAPRPRPGPTHVRMHTARACC